MLTRYCWAVYICGCPSSGLVYPSPDTPITEVYYSVFLQRCYITMLCNSFIYHGPMILPDKGVIKVLGNTIAVLCSNAM